MSAVLSIGGDVIHASAKMVLFDKEGTLIDIHHYWSSMIKIRADHIVEKWVVSDIEQSIYYNKLIDGMGVDLKTGRIKLNGPVGIKPRQYIVKVAADVVRGLGVNITDKDMESLFREVDHLTESNLHPLLKLLPGVEKLLKQLTYCDVQMVIVSTDMTDRAKRAMESLKLNNYFSEIIGGDLVDKTKPAADLALLALSKTELTADDAVVIGDHPVDIEMGVKAGVSVNIGVLNGIANRSAFFDHDCFMVNNLNNIQVECTGVS